MDIRLITLISKMFRSWSHLILVSVGICLVTGCRLSVSSLEPKLAQNLPARSLTNAQMLAYLKANQLEIKKNEWHEEQLILAGFYYNAEMESGRARLEELNEESRKNKTFAFTTHDQLPDPFKVPPWVFSTGSDAPGLARGASLSGLYEYADLSWRVRSRVRKYLLEYVLTREQVDVLHAEFDAQAKRPPGNESNGVGSPADLIPQHIRLREAETASRNAKVKLSESIGVSVQQLDQVNIAPIQREQPDFATAHDLKKLQHFALFNRLDVRKALLRFWMSEMSLKEIMAAQKVPQPSLLGLAWNGEAGKIELHSLPASATNTANPMLRDSIANLQKAGTLLLTLQSEIITNLSQALEDYVAATRNLRVGEEKLQKVSSNLSVREGAPGAKNDVNSYALLSLRQQKNLLHREFLELLYKAHLAKFRLEEILQAPLNALIY